MPPDFPLVQYYNLQSGPCCVKSRKIKYITNAQVMEIVGDRKKVTGVRYRDRNSAKESVVETDGVFIYVGLVPQTG